MKKIDVESWDRREIYNTFIGYSNPIFSISTRLDVTELVAFSKRNGTAFFTDFMYVVVKCLNAIEPFRLRLVGGDVVLYDVINPSYIVMTDKGVIAACRSEMKDRYAEFYPACRADIAAARRSPVEPFNRGTNDLFFISCMYWVDIRSMTNPYDLKNGDVSSIPRLTWGKYVDEGGRLMMTLDIAAHHALIDGEPVCRAMNDIQKAINDPEAFLKN